MNLGLAFLTGLTTGGLSCLVVQGGLLASSVAQQAEQTIGQHTAKSNPGRAAHKRSKARQSAYQENVANARSLPGLVRPITLFLMAKLVVYTILGFLLGWLGSMLQLTPFMQAVMQLAIGIFMLGTALRLFNVHPFFRIFAIEPPAFVTRYIRRRAKNSTGDAVTPIFLGVLTVLIPCGVTQVMMAAAVGAGDPLQGAAIMFAFTLGASPLFFTLAYLATQLGKQLERRFTQFIGVTVFILGLVAINTGLNLMGTPLFPRNLATARTANVANLAAAQVAPVAVAGASNGGLPSTWRKLSPAEAGASSNASSSGFQPGVQGNVITINVLDGGYEPQVVNAPAGQPLQLRLVTNNVWG